MSIVWVRVCLMWVSCSTCIIIHGSSRDRKGQMPYHKSCGYCVLLGMLGNSYWERVLFQLYLMFLVLIKSVVHGNGRGTRLSTCLVYATYVVSFVACVNGDRFSVMYLILLQSVVHGHERGTRLGTCLVYATCVADIVACMTVMNCVAQSRHMQTNDTLVQNETTILCCK